MIKLKLLHILPKRISNRYLNYLIKKPNNYEIVNQYLKNKRKVKIGKYTYGSCTQPGFNIGGEVEIGNYCSIGGNVHYFGANHPMDWVSTSAYFYNKKFGYHVDDVKRNKLVIGNDVWIGYGVIITCGCKYIGDGAVIGAGSIVTKDVEPYSVVAGNPARKIKSRFDENTINALNSSMWWNKDIEYLMKDYELIKDVKEFIKMMNREIK